MATLQNIPKKCIFSKEADMSLKTIIGDRIMENVIKPTRNTPTWKILVLDRLCVRIISSCCKMKDIVDGSVTLVEDLCKKRQPLPSFDVLYFITPSKESVDHLLADFKDERKYNNVHLFFTDPCPDHLFQLICCNPVAKSIKTVKEINVAFLPYEPRVFSLDCPDSFQHIYNPNYRGKRDKALERMAEQLSTVCAALGEYPSIRYRHEGDKPLLLAQLLQSKLDAFKADNPTMGLGPEKSRSQLIILDRSFDLVSVLVHELTYQAMVHDLLPIDNDVYRYETQQQGQPGKEVLLDEDDSLWASFRHQHIAIVSQKVTSQLKEFAKKTRMSSGDKTTMRDLSNMLKKMPQYQNELSKYSTHLHMAEDCMKHYTDRVEKLCKVEQDLATGSDSKRDNIKEPIKSVVPILLDKALQENDKLRVIILFILLKNGIPEDTLRKLFAQAELSEADMQTVRNLALMGLNVNNYEGKKRSGAKIPRRHREAKYQLSRWCPVIKDVMEMVIEDKLDQRLFPFLLSRGTALGKPGIHSARYSWHTDKGSADKKCGPRLFIFVIGGVSCSEMRCAYEVTNQQPDKPDKWQVLIGSSCILKPVSFIEELGRLSQTVTFQDEKELL